MRAEITCTRYESGNWVLRVKRLSDDGTEVRQDVIEFDDEAFALLHANREINGERHCRTMRGRVAYFAGEERLNDASVDS